MPDQATYAFGAFSYDALRGLRRGGHVIALAPREQWLLRRLLQGGGEVVSHESLHRNPFSDITASAPSLHRSILHLRRALNDTRRSVVVSVNGVGYRIGLPVAVAAAAAQPVSPGSAPQAPAVPSPRPDEAELLPPEPLPRDARLAGDTARLERALQTSPHNPALCADYADVLITRMVRGYIRPADHGGRALEAVERALAAAPDDAPALAAKGWLCGALAPERHTGLKLIERARRLDPGRARTAFLLVWLLIAEQRLEDARLELERALSHTPLDVDLLWMRAWLLCARRQFLAARAVTEAGLRHAPGSDLLWVCDAIARVRLGEKKSAHSSIRTAVLLSPRDWLIRGNVGWVRAATGGRFGYAELLSWLSVPSLDYTAPFMSAVVCHAMGDRAASAEFLRIAQRDRDPWCLLAWCDPRLQT